MLTQLATVKARLAIPDATTTDDALLTNAIAAISARFDKECRRALARTINALQEFDADETEIRVTCYPIETVAKFELKTSESQGWIEQAGVEYLIRRNCVISLSRPFSIQPLAFSLFPSARVTYTGGYILPGDPDPQSSTPGSQPVRLPADLEQAAVEQAAFWFQNRDRLGLQRVWDYHSTYRQFAELDLLPSVRAVLAKYERVVW